MRARVRLRVKVIVRLRVRVIVCWLYWGTGFVGGKNAWVRGGRGYVMQVECGDGRGKGRRGMDA